MLTPLPINSYPNRMLSRSFIVVVFSALGLLSGVAPDISGRFGSIVFSSAAYAQDFSDSDIAKFSRAAFAIEMERRSTQQKISSLTGGNVPEVSCDRPEALANLSEGIRNEFESFCEFSANKIKDNGLDVGQFNAIKNRYNSDPAIKKRVNQELRRLRG
jgi:Domain of unknown function (DUF4168)